MLIARGWGSLAPPSAGSSLAASCTRTAGGGGERTWAPLAAASLFKKLLFLFPPGLACSSFSALPNEASAGLGISFWCKQLASPQWYCRNPLEPSIITASSTLPAETCIIWRSSRSKFSRGGAPATGAELAAASPTTSSGDDIHSTSGKIFLGVMAAVSPRIWSYPGKMSGGLWPPDLPEDKVLFEERPTLLTAPRISGLDFFRARFAGLPIHSCHLSNR